jgi:hypothetical protein
MARADEAPRRLHEAHRAAEVHAARGDRDELVELVGLVGVDLVVALADVRRRLAGLPDAVDDRDDLGDVGGRRKSSGGADRRQRCSCFSNTGPRAKPSAGSTKAETATAPATLTVPVMNRRRVTVSPSKAPGIPRSAVYLLVVFRRSSAISGGETLSTPESTDR